jgi:hypothetical protein
MQSELFNRLVSLASGSRFRDVASETRALHRQVAGETPLYGDLYRYLPLLAERLGFRVQEIPAAQHSRATAPVVHAPRIYLWRAIDILSIFFISRFTRHPLRLFGGVGSAFAAVGLVILLIVAIQRFAGTDLAERPVLVLGTLLVGLGVQAFTIGHCDLRGEPAPARALISRPPGGARRRHHGDGAVHLVFVIALLLRQIRGELKGTAAR